MKRIAPLVSPGRVSAIGGFLLAAAWFPAAGLPAGTVREDSAPRAALVASPEPGWPQFRGDHITWGLSECLLVDEEVVYLRYHDTLYCHDVRAES
jgi:hypothetical protein